ncbi:Ham1 family protein [Bacteriovorax sp. BSW11_IV]|uniref:non-canonical purine NTP pyrophosphatase n=1 Tax=Bacteriovorax sp. BSW11_IV TaxID=1353529 RepID=UPI000389EAC6|nr:non-canonical purine NTP pyrophosphatase [Bacteriovorax sp. BSW11_IV]EQC46299.1 Ham1 family protein [Bacteriovorax sp. BSW11_IV]
MKFILASTNEHKAEEFNELFDKEIVEVVAATDKFDVEENGKTFAENALIKAKAYYDKYKVPVMSDDSGLCVKAMPNDLGIYTARFGGPGLSAKERAELLVEKMKDVVREDRGAYFVCVLCFYLNPDEIFFFEGRVDGHIGHEYKGEFGFGYDPVFHPDGEHEHSTLAMVPEWKSLNSHRSVACRLAQKFFHERVCQS